MYASQYRSTINPYTSQDAGVGLNIYIFYYSGSQKMKGFACALFGVAMHHTLITWRDTYNKAVMFITGA